MKKIIIILSLLLLAIPVSAAKVDDSKNSETKFDFSGEINFEFKDIPVNSEDGKYVRIEDVFDYSKADLLESRSTNQFFSSTELNLDFLRQIGDKSVKINLETLISEKLEGRKSYDDLSLNAYKVIVQNKDVFTTVISNELNPKFNRYVLPQNIEQSDDSDDIKLGEKSPYTEGILTRGNLDTSLLGSIDLRGVLLQDQTQNDINDYPVDGSGNLYVYGLETEVNPLEELVVSSTFMRTKDQKEDKDYRENFSESRSRNNFAVSTEYSLAQFFSMDSSINTNIALTTWGDEAKNYNRDDNIENGGLIVFTANAKPIDSLETKLTYKNITKGYSPVRRIEEIEENSAVEKIMLDTVDGSKTYNEVISLPNEKGFEAIADYKPLDAPFNPVINLEFSSFTDSRSKTDEKKTNLMLGIKIEETDLFKIEADYELEKISDYKDRDDNTTKLNLYGNYKVFNTYEENKDNSGAYSFNVEGGWENIAFKNQKQDIKTLENVIAVGLDGEYSFLDNLKLISGYALEFRNYKRQENYNAMMNVISTGLEYEMMKNTTFELGYNYKNYSGSKKNIKYYNRDFATSTLELNMNIEF